jgi:hypothetical protein
MKNGFKISAVISATPAESYRQSLAQHKRSYIDDRQRCSGER